MSDVELFFDDEKISGWIREQQLYRDQVKEHGEIPHDTLFHHFRCTGGQVIRSANGFGGVNLEPLPE